MLKNPKLQRISPQGQLLNTIQQHSVTGWDIGSDKNNKPMDPIDHFRKLQSELRNAKQDTLINNDKILKSNYTVNLTSGRFNGAKVNPKIIDELIASANRQGIDPYKMIALAGRESTLGTAKRGTESIRDYRDIVSGWDNVSDKMPYDAMRFLADKKVPGIIPFKGNGQIDYDVKDSNGWKQANNAVALNPKLLAQYQAKLAKTGNIGTQNSFDFAAQKIKRDGFKTYNPGDPDYPNKIQADYNLLKKDPALSKYIQNKSFQAGTVPKENKTTADVEAPRMPNDINDFMGHKDMLDHQDNNLVQSFLT